MLIYTSDFSVRFEVCEYTLVTKIALECDIGVSRGLERQGKNALWNRACKWSLRMKNEEMKGPDDKQIFCFDWAK